MKGKAIKFLLPTTIMLIAATNANAQDNDKNKVADAMRDTTNWKEYKVMPAIQPVPKMPDPQDKLYNAYVFWHVISQRYAEALRDPNNWKEYQVQPPLQPEKMNQIQAIQNAKVR